MSWRVGRKVSDGKQGKYSFHFGDNGFLGLWNQAFSGVQPIQGRKIQNELGSAQPAV
jgi:hypothetical protein